MCRLREQRLLGFGVWVGCVGVRGLANPGGTTGSGRGELTNSVPHHPECSLNAKQEKKKNKVPSALPPPRPPLFLSLSLERTNARCMSEPAGDYAYTASGSPA